MSNSKGFSIVRSGLTVATITLLAKVLSFVRDMLLARYYGATAFSDIVLTSTSLVLLLSVFIRSPFSAAYLPIATDVYLLKTDKDKERFFGSVYAVMVAAGLVTVCVDYFLLDFIITAFMPGFSGEDYLILKKMMIIQLPIVIFAFGGVVNYANLKVLNRFGISEISVGLITACFVLYLFVFKNSLPVYGIAWCMVMAYALNFVVGIVCVSVFGIKPRWSLNIKNFGNEFRPIFIAMIPFIVSSGAKEINVLADKAIASLLDKGSITMQSYASKMTVTEVGLIATAISAVIAAQASKYNSLKEKEKLDELVCSGLKFVNTLMIPCCVFTIILRKEIISVLFGHGAFTYENVVITANTMMIYAIGMLGNGFEEVLLNTMVATKHKRFPMVVSLIFIGLNIFLNFMLYKPFGIYGLAAASAFVAIAKVPCYIIYTNNKITKILEEKIIWSSVVRTFVASAISGTVCLLMKKLIVSLCDNDIVSLAISGGVGLLSLIVLLCLFGNEYALAVKGRLIRRK
ncbi:MAG: polysaccharide biosynthesis C-terminal domain-containing protein [Lachnospiraceae bacterium]|nr:polysaccharide biosynthesis C-terminal domain-containing protein [Lachnospiraceae bacterium]